MFILALFPPSSFVLLSSYKSPLKHYNNTVPSYRFMQLPYKSDRKKVMSKNTWILPFIFNYVFTLFGVFISSWVFELLNMFSFISTRRTPFLQDRSACDGASQCSVIWECLNFSFNLKGNSAGFGILVNSLFLLTLKKNRSFSGLLASIFSDGKSVVIKGCLHVMNHLI